MHIAFVTGNPSQSDAWVTALRSALPQARVSTWHDSTPLPDVDYAVVLHPPAAFFAHPRPLRAVFTMSAGVDALLAMPGLPKDVPVIRLEDAGMAVQMAEYALHALLRVSRNFETYARHQQESTWLQLPAPDRRGWSVGVLGLGQVGARVAQTIAAFGYPTLGWARSRHELSGVRCYAGDAELPQFLAGTRVLINTLPLTSATREILNAGLFAQLLPQAHIINIGRGGHLVEADLLAALANGQIAGATLDVFNTEPLPPDHPFWSHPQIHVTPHIAALTLRETAVAQAAEKILQFAQGQPVSGVVKRDREY